MSIFPIRFFTLIIIKFRETPMNWSRLAGSMSREAFVIRSSWTRRPSAVALDNLLSTHRFPYLADEYPINRPAISVVHQTDGYGNHRHAHVFQNISKEHEVHTREKKNNRFESDLSSVHIDF